MEEQPSIIAILLGRHVYSMSPELETGWIRATLLIGMLIGAVTTAAILGL